MGREDPNDCLKFTENKEVSHEYSIVKCRREKNQGC